MPSPLQPTTTSIILATFAMNMLSGPARCRKYFSLAVVKSRDIEFLFHKNQQTLPLVGKNMVIVFVSILISKDICENLQSGTAATFALAFCVHSFTMFLI